MLAKALMPLAERLDRRFGWQRLPYYARPRHAHRPAGAAAPEQPLQHGCTGRGPPAAARRARGAPDGRELQRPLAARDGHGGRAVRAQRPGAPGPGSARRAAPARRQRRADGPHAVPARLAPERARRRVAAVRGPRLDEPRQGAADRRLAAGRGHAAAEGGPDRRRPAGVRLPRAALVGRVAALRHARRTTSPRSSASTARSPSTTICCARSSARPRTSTRPRPACGSGSRRCCILFAHEHNAIVRHLRAAYPERGAPWLYAKARLINSALMAKIHTVEWTPAIIGHPTTVGAIKATW